MTGSALVIAADSEEEIREFLRNDIYSQGGAWNVDKATVCTPAGALFEWCADSVQIMPVGTNCRSPCPFRKRTPYLMSSFLYAPGKRSS